MDFRKRKLPMEATSQLRMCPIGTVKPYALMIAPVYVLLRRNQKYVSVKAPLDFFSPEELERLKSFEMFFLPEFVDSALPYRQLARRARVVLGWNPLVDSGPGNPPTAVPPAPFELADALLRVMAPLWDEQAGIESFFVTVFSNEFCALLPGEELRAARDRDLEGFERAAILSAWMVFLSLHLGISDAGYLDSLRLGCFREALGQKPGDGIALLEDQLETGDLYRLLQEMLAGNRIYGGLHLRDFEARSERVAQKIVARIRRVSSELRSAHPLSGTVFGERGFADV